MERESKTVDINQDPEHLSGSVMGNPRNKVILRPGRSLMDWMRLGHSGKDLTGVGGHILEITPLELAKHNTKQDAWICLKGKVYNVTPYMEYHPGGDEELMKGVGKDATALFNNVHQWVNVEAMLKKCFIGYLNTSPLTLLGHPKIKVLKSTIDLKPESSTEVKCSPSLQEEKSVPSWRWSQTKNEAVVIIMVSMSPHGKVRREDVTYHHHVSKLNLRLLLPNHIYSLKLALPDACTSVYKVSVNHVGGINEIVVCLRKSDQRTWADLTCSAENDTTYSRRSAKSICYHRCTLTAKYPVTHDTRLLKLEFPTGMNMRIPIGYHVGIKATVEGVEVLRYYTPVSRTLTPAFQVEDQDRIIYLMIKIYSSGTLTPLLDNIHIGETLDVSDHLGNFQESRLNSCCYLVLLAAGTGFTPMVRLLRWALFHLDVIRLVKLMFFNKEEKDILWKSSLDELAEKNPRFEVCYVLSSPHTEWQGRAGRIRQHLLEEFLPLKPDTESTFLCICGPTSFTNEGLRILEKMKFPLSHIHAFRG